ncbi:MAG: SurA N-terminal domain-containing protein [Candidatus Daviesbacteria bacterium]|nr:SurA N-terminal domain-containing protein [Candidatus Daviesbacteria bacterium]
MAKKSTPKIVESSQPFGKVNNLLEKFSKYKDFRSSKKFYAILIIAGLLLLAIYKKNWFIAASVNGSPVSNLELQMRLNQQFRSQSLTQMVNEKLILNEAAKNSVVVSEADINNKISEIETSVGGPQAFDAMLAQQGLTRQGIRQQIKLQLSIEKLYANEATVSGEEVTKFVEQNKDQLRASDSAGQQKEAFDAIKSQKLTQVFSQKFQDLKAKAKIQIF